MDTDEALRAMVGRAGMSLRGASVASGRAPGWLTSTLTRGSTPTLPVAADLARACGQVVAIIPADEVPPGAIVIDPPRP